jgi:hypothetical protein
MIRFSTPVWSLHQTRGGSKNVEVPEFESFVEDYEHHVCTECEPDRTFLSADTLKQHVDGSH